MRGFDDVRLMRWAGYSVPLSRSLLLKSSVAQERDRRPRDDYLTKLPRKVRTDMDRFEYAVDLLQSVGCCHRRQWLSGCCPNKSPINADPTYQA